MFAYRLRIGLLDAWNGLYIVRCERKGINLKSKREGLKPLGTLRVCF